MFRVNVVQIPSDQRTWFVDSYDSTPLCNFPVQEGGEMLFIFLFDKVLIDIYACVRPYEFVGTNRPTVNLLAH